MNTNVIHSVNQIMIFTGLCIYFVIRMTSFAVEFTQTDARQNLLGVIGEITAEHPAEITRVTAENIRDNSAFIFAEIENLLLLWLSILVHERIAIFVRDSFPHYAARKVNIIE